MEKNTFTGKITDVGPSGEAIANAHRFRRLVKFLVSEGMRIPDGETPAQATFSFVAKLALDAARCVIEPEAK